LEIDLHQVLKEWQEKENVTGEDQYIIKASLTWINEFCPAMQDSVIESEGRELVLCNNPECFVVYHKRCLDSLRQAGVSSCLVCGLPT
jgi:ABC-type enterochelin transport system substrate-binding protein